MSAILDEIVAHKRQEVAARQGVIPYAELAARETPLATGLFEAALRGEGSGEKVPRLILEIKPASPSAGVMQARLNLPEVLNHYNRYASAISVLTDEKFFQGSLDLLRQVVAASPHPTLCKDFILDPYQVLEARQAGAEAVLLIVKSLDDATLKILHQAIRDLGMTPVVEIQTLEERERALALSPSVLLINNRNLSTFDIDLETTRRLAEGVPEGIVVISASGIQTRRDMEGLLPVTDCFLIGSALMQAGDLGATLAALTGSV